jgi:hypothetical protein
MRAAGCWSLGTLLNFMLLLGGGVVAAVDTVSINLEEDVMELDDFNDLADDFRKTVEVRKVGIKE